MAECFTADAVLLLIPLATIIGKRSVLIAGAVLSAPTLLLCIAHTFPLMVIPLVAMILRLASVDSRLPNEEPRLSQYVGADPGVFRALYISAQLCCRIMARQAARPGRPSLGSPRPLTQIY